MELLEELPPPPKTPSEAASMLLEASRSSPADPAVLRARAALHRRLEQRPGPLDGLGDLWANLDVRPLLKP